MKIVFGSIILFIISLVILYIYITFKSTERINDFNQNYTNTTTIDSIDREIQAYGKAISYSFMELDPIKVESHIFSSEYSFQNVLSGLELLQETVPQKAEELKKVQKLFVESDVIVDQVLELSRMDNNTEAASLYFDVALPILLQGVADMEEIQTYILADGENVLDSIEAASIRNLLIIMAGSTVAVTFAIIISSVVIREIVNPVEEIENVAKGLTEGLFDVELHYLSKDELGKLADSMRELMETTKIVISDLNIGLGELAQGNFDFKSNKVESYMGSYKPLLTSMNEIIMKLSLTLNEIKQVADKVSLGSEQVSSDAQIFAEGANQQAESIEELTMTFGELSKQIKQTAQNAENAKNSAGRAQNEVVFASEKMNGMMAAMSKINDKSQEIEQIIKTIEDIAFQTNLLALNAAIEAASAGEAGKGFAVVADEVRELASKSVAAAADTNRLIKDTVEAVSNGTDMAKATAQSIKAVVTSTKDIIQFIDIIADTSKDQASNVTLVTEAVNQISTVIQENSNTTENSAKGSEELSKQANKLKELINVFSLCEIED